MKRNKTLESDAMNHGNKFCHPANDEEHQQQAAASSSSCSNSSIATQYTAAGRYIRIHARTSCSSVQYTNYNRSGPGILCCETAHGVYVTKRETTNYNTQSSSSSASSTIYVYKTDFSIALTTLQSSSTIVHILTLEQKKN